MINKGACVPKREKYNLVISGSTAILVHAVSDSTIEGNILQVNVGTEVSGDFIG
jgi:hypothetical protein